MDHRTAFAGAAALVVVVVLTLAAAPSPASADVQDKKPYYNPNYEPTKPFPPGINYDDKNYNIRNNSRPPNRFDYVEPDDKDARLSMCWAYLGHRWVVRETKEWFIHRVAPSDFTCTGIMHTHIACFPDMFFIWPFVRQQNAMNLLKHCMVYHQYKDQSTPGWHGPPQPSAKVLPVPPVGRGRGGPADNA